MSQRATSVTGSGHSTPTSVPDASLDTASAPPSQPSPPADPLAAGHPRTWLPAGRHTLQAEAEGDVPAQTLSDLLQYAYEIGLDLGVKAARVPTPSGSLSHLDHAADDRSVDRARASSPAAALRTNPLLDSVRFTEMVQIGFDNAVLYAKGTLLSLPPFHYLPLKMREVGGTASKNMHPHPDPKTEGKSEQVAKHPEANVSASTHSLSALNKNAAPQGFPNFQDNCFINALSQCLLVVVPELMDHHPQWSHFVKSRTKSSLIALLSRLNLPSASSRQQDASETLQALLRGTKPDLANPNAFVQSDAAGHPLIPMMTSLYVEVRNCRHCAVETSREEIPTGIIVCHPDAKKKVITKSDLLQTLLSVELGQDSVHSAREGGCGRNNCVVISRKVQSLAKVLVFLIDRTPKSMVRVELQEQFEESNGTEVQPHEYDLAAACEHLGESRGSGHYVATVRAADGSWYQCNDSIVSNISSQWGSKAESKVKEHVKKASLLFFVRSDRSMVQHVAPPLPSLRNDSDSVSSPPPPEKTIPMYGHGRPRRRGIPRAAALPPQPQLERGYDLSPSVDDTPPDSDRILEKIRLHQDLHRMQAAITTKVEVLKLRLQKKLEVLHVARRRILEAVLKKLEELKVKVGAGGDKPGEQQKFSDERLLCFLFSPCELRNILEPCHLGDSEWHRVARNVTFQAKRYWSLALTDEDRTNLAREIESSAEFRQCKDGTTIKELDFDDFCFCNGCGALKQERAAFAKKSTYESVQVPVGLDKKLRFKCLPNQEPKHLPLAAAESVAPVAMTQLLDTMGQDEPNNEAQLLPPEQRQEQGAESTREAPPAAHTGAEDLGEDQTTLSSRSRKRSRHAEVAAEAHEETEEGEHGCASPQPMVPEEDVAPQPAEQCQPEPQEPEVVAEAAAAVELTESSAGTLLCGEQHASATPSRKRCRDEEEEPCPCPCPPEPAADPVPTLMPATDGKRAVSVGASTRQPTGPADATDADPAAPALQPETAVAGALPQEAIAECEALASL
jgi:hypothetical protein